MFLNLKDRIRMRGRQACSPATPEAVARYMRRHGAGTVRVETGAITTGSGDPWLDVNAYLIVVVKTKNGEKRKFALKLFHESNICFPCEVRKARRKAEKQRRDFLAELAHLVRLDAGGASTPLLTFKAA